MEYEVTVTLKFKVRSELGARTLREEDIRTGITLPRGFRTVKNEDTNLTFDNETSIEEGADLSDGLCGHCGDGDILNYRGLCSSCEQKEHEQDMKEFTEQTGELTEEEFEDNNKE